MDVVSKHFALDAHLRVCGQVGEVQRHQRLQVVGVQQFAIVGVILQGEAAADAIVLDLPDFTGVLLFLEGTNVWSYIKGRDKHDYFSGQRIFTAVWGKKRKEKEKKTYLVGAEERDDIGLHLRLGFLRNTVIIWRRLNKKTISKCF